MLSPEPILDVVRGLSTVSQPLVHLTEYYASSFWLEKRKILMACALPSTFICLASTHEGSSEQQTLYAGNG